MAMTFSHLERYRITNHGANPWSAEGIRNVLLHMGHFERARELVDGRFTSVYRSVRVNTAVKGAPRSRHLRGLACDIKPQFLKPRAAQQVLHEAYMRGELGNVWELLAEPTWVHMSWNAPGESLPLKLLAKDSKSAPWVKVTL